MFYLIVYSDLFDHQLSEYAIMIEPYGNLCKTDIL